MKSVVAASLIAGAVALDFGPNCADLYSQCQCANWGYVRFSIIDEIKAACPEASVCDNDYRNTADATEELAEACCQELCMHEAGYLVSCSDPSWVPDARAMPFPCCTYAGVRTGPCMNGAGVSV